MHKCADCRYAQLSGGCCGMLRKIRQIFSSGAAKVESPVKSSAKHGA